jgi:hypothetical protein
MNSDSDCKVLLPYHSAQLVTFTLEARGEASEASEAPCFVWSSSRPDIVAVQPIHDDAAGQCSSRALVAAVSKHAQRYTSIILAKETSKSFLLFHFLALCFLLPFCEVPN